MLPWRDLENTNLPIEPSSGLSGSGRHRTVSSLLRASVLVGDAAGRVGGQLDPQLAPGDVQVGVMTGGLTQVTDQVDGHQGGGPAVGVELAADPGILVVPLAQSVLGQLAGNLVFGVGPLFAHRRILCPG